MPVPTTTIGAYPKPAYLPRSGWHQTVGGPAGEPAGFDYVSSGPADGETDLAALADRATAAAIADQVSCGVDVPTDGEQRRDNYVHYHCRHLQGIDFSVLTERVHRAGAAIGRLPTVTAPIEPDGSDFLVADYRFAAQCVSQPLKMTVPGPLTIVDTTANHHYATAQELATGLADAINHELRAVVAAGCTEIQIDEPVFARYPDQALDFGIDCLDRCLDGIGPEVTKTVHLCCGYPGQLDDPDYEKADPEVYFRLAGPLDASTVDQISIEDAHRNNDLRLLEQFVTSTVVLGLVAIASSRVEPAEEMAARLDAALGHIDRDRLVAAPDCGLLMLDRDLAMSKLSHLCEAARSIG